MTILLARENQDPVLSLYKVSLFVRLGTKYSIRSYRSLFPAWRLWRSLPWPRMNSATFNIVKGEGMQLNTKILAMQNKKHSGKPGKVTNEHIALPIQAMDELFRGFHGTAGTVEPLKSSGLVTYKLAWPYFPKDSMLFCGSSDSERVCRSTPTWYRF